MCHGIKEAGSLRNCSAASVVKGKIIRPGTTAVNIC